MDQDPLYTIELWSNAGLRVADISALAKNRRYTLQRNAAETLSFSLDLNEFERFCVDDLNSDPEVVLWEGRTDIKVKRGGEYLFGTQLVNASTTAGVDSQTISVTATGYLNLFKDRYVTKTYTATESGAIARDLIDTTQTYGGSVGVTLASSPYPTGVNRDRTFTRDNVKDKIVGLTNLVDGNFDFAFSYDKKFQIYESLGARRGDISLIYGGEASNIRMLYANKDATRLFNQLIGLGSGFGADQLVSYATDAGSALNYYGRQKIEQFNSVVEQATLDQNTAAALYKYSQPIRIPQVTITGNEMQSGFINIGDRVPFAVVGHPFLASFTGLYRVEKIDVQIDDNGFENEVMLYFDNLGVDQGEEA